MSDNRYRITQVAGSLPTIVDSRGVSVLAIDEREVNGSTYITPVFASQKIAGLVLEALNGSSTQ